MVERSLQQKRLAEENRLLRQALADRKGFESIVGKSAPIQQLLDLAERVARSESSIVIEGETGTGKELIARGLHLASPRCQGPFLPINCAALPEHLLESELFGHERGSFTGAHTRKQGLLEAASKGTVFLDEISSLGMDLQAKLLRVLQERQVRRVGGRELIDVDIRVVSATNEAMSEAIAGDRFRRDLYYRLNVITLRVPPLRERSEDVPLLAEKFLLSLEEKHPRGVKGFSSDAMDLMQAYAWPGNVRELQNVVERAYLLTDSDYVIALDLPAQIREVSASGLGVDLNVSYSDAKETFLQPFERHYLIEILKQNAGNVTAASQQAGLHRSSFQRLMRRHEIESDDFRS